MILLIFVLLSIFNFVKFTKISPKIDKSKGLEALKFYSKEYLCLSFNISDLIKKDYKFNITCPDKTLFFYISKFGSSPTNEEGENIANCYSKSFKNLIRLNNSCNFGENLDYLLTEHKHKAGAFEVMNGNLNFMDSLISCSKKNNKEKIFLSYSCYYPYLTEKNITRKEFIIPIVRAESICITLCFVILVMFRIYFYRDLKNLENINIKDLTLMIDNLDVKKTNLPKILNSIIHLISNKINTTFYFEIQEINYSFINSEEKELFEEFNYLYIKKIYLEKELKENSNKELPRSILFKILFKIFFCFKKTYKEEYINTKNKLKSNINKIISMKDSPDNIRKIYITFTDYNAKEKMKNASISINDKIYKFKNADMSPHDINWENININNYQKIMRIFLSYFILFLFIGIYFMLIIFLSKLKNNFENKFNFKTDCSNVNYNNHINIYYEYINKDKTEKEKILSYCYCASELNGNKINYNNINFDPCEKYNKYKYNRKLLIYCLPALESLIGFFIPMMVDKIISIQKFESKSKNNNLILIISIIILIFEKIFSVLLVYARFNSKKDKTYFFDGIYEDFTPDWINNVLQEISNSGLIYCCIYAYVRVLKFLGFEKLNYLLGYFNLFFTNEPINSFYNFYNIYAPKEDINSFIIFTVYSFFLINMLIFSSLYYFIYTMTLFVMIIYLKFEDGGLYFKHSYSFVTNKQYYRIIFCLMNIIFIFRLIIGIWWYSSEYFFIDLNQDSIYDELIYKNIEQLDQFLKGESNIKTKIKIKLLLKRNLWLLIPIGIIIITELIILIVSNIKKSSKNYSNKVLNFLDKYRQIKLYQYYRLLNYKINEIYLKKNNNLKYLKDFIFYKLMSYLRLFLNKRDFSITDNDHKKIIDLKNYIIDESQKDYENNYNFGRDLEIKNNDCIYTPFILEDYEVSFNLKFIFSPYYP